ncbi:hypothetical protein EVAR_93740_1 [Eumeta japonica]|uniref:Uncharacterized protein n=1 Tax=Eumeta variegata TaxID=151549 RepID=A0A4C1U474_EUMVA|nr:hypothetical protein EVAR_93740_1 [Eumeta japonica]
MFPFYVVPKRSCKWVASSLRTGMIGSIRGACSGLIKRAVPAGARPPTSIGIVTADGRGDASGRRGGAEELRPFSDCSAR